MRSATLTGILFIASTIVMNAQKLSLTPQVGFENSKTSINYNNLGFFAPLGTEFNPQLSLRLDYKFKQGFGPYFGISTSRSVVLYSFSDIENGMNSYNATNGNMQVRMEAGYQYTIKPILFNRSKGSTQIKTSGKSSCGNYSYRSNCSGGLYSHGSCCQSKSNSTRKAESKNKGGWFRLQPSAGIGFIPSPKTDVISKTEGGQTVYEYRAGNWNTAFMTGMGFEFGRNKQRLLSVSVNYFTGIGNLDKQTISDVSGTKANYTNLESKASGWNMRIGIPFTLAEKGTSKQKNVNRTKKTSCCERIRLEYKSHCRMQ
jgi:hypothetical protein